MSYWSQKIDLKLKKFNTKQKTIILFIDESDNVQENKVNCFQNLKYRSSYSQKQILSNKITFFVFFFLLVT